MKIPSIACIACLSLFSACRHDRGVALDVANQLFGSNRLIFEVTDVVRTNFIGYNVDDLPAIRVTGARWNGQVPIRAFTGKSLLIFENDTLELLVKNAIRSSIAQHSADGEWILTLRPSKVFHLIPLPGSTNAIVKEFSAQNVWISTW